MPAIAVNPPFPLFTDADGQPLDDAYIYIGTANQNPVSNPIAVYWDEALTIPAAQPIRTNAGFAVRNGSPSRFYAGANYSILVRDKNGSFVYTAADENLFSSVDATFIQSGTGAVTRSVQDKLRESVSVKDFGAVGDGVTDDWAAIRAALDSGARKIFFPAGTYYCTKALLLYKKYLLEGEGGFQSGSSPSVLKFADTTCGIVVHRYNTTCDDYGYNQTTTATLSEGADGTVIRHLTIIRGTGSDTTIDGVTHGIRFRARAHVDSCYVAGFAGNGIHIVAASGSTPDNEGNANNWGVSNTRVQNCNHGMFVDSADVNVGLGLHVDCSSNAGWGFFDSSFLGCNWVGCHTNSNVTGSYKTDNANARSVFIGCYTEGGQVNDLISPTLVLGGLVDPSGALTIGKFGSYEGTLQANGAVTGTLRAVESWNTGSVNSARAATYNFKSGSTTNFLPIGAMRGRPTASSAITTGAIGIELYRANATTTVSITGITQANPGVITTGSAHGFVANDRVNILSVGGMTQLNGPYLVNTVPTSTSFTVKLLDNTVVDTTAFSAYTSGGTVGKPDGYATIVETGATAFYPGADNTYSNGTAALRWSVVYAATGTINTSDVREKQQVNELSETERAVAKRLKGLMRTYRWNDAVERKGDKARIHVGVIAQDVMAAFKAEGLDAGNYGILCFDSWPDEFDEDGNKTREAGNRYGVRYDQLFAFVIAVL